jgi:predicted GNAT family acetyltransferase
LAEQEQRVREAVEQDKKWTDEVLNAIQANRVPKSQHRPKGLKDLEPGNVILVAPSEGAAGLQSRWIRATDNWITGMKTPASHALTFIGRDAGGRALFLDHQLGEGSRIIGETEFRQTYAGRGMDVAAVAKAVDMWRGRTLLATALDAAERENKHKGLGTGFGVFGKDLVCSEVAAVAVGKATGIDFQREGPLESRRRIAHVDITPGDFYDDQRIGKYFVISPLEAGSAE